MSRAVSAARDRTLDGIRGYAIVLVLLSHSWAVAPTTDWSSVSWLFFSGDYAVTIFLVISGFLVTRTVLDELARTGRTRPLVTWGRRWIRISAHVYPLVLVILALGAVTPSVAAAYEGTDNRASALHIMTYTWSGFLRTNAADARPDFGHLWYVCTDIWSVALVLAIVFVVGRRRVLLVLALAAAIALITVYRGHVVDTEGVFTALIRVQTRADGLVWGALAAAVLPWARRWSRYARPVLVGTVLALVPLMGLVFDELDYLGAWGVVLNLDVALLVLALSLTEPPALMRRTVGSGPLVTLGRYSLVLYLWHYPLFWYVAKLDTSWGWRERTVVAYALTLVFAVLATALIERPLQRWMRADGWHALDRGVWPAVVGVLRRPRRRAAHAERRSDTPAPREESGV